MVIDQFLHQTFSVIYFTKFIFVTLGNLPVLKAETICYILISLFRVHLVIDQCKNQTLSVPFFTEMVWVKFLIEQ